MKRRIAALVAAGLVLAVAGPARATDVQSQIAVGRSDIQADRQAIVAANMKLSEQQAAAFWPVYREYRAELAKQGDRLVKLVTDYAASYDKLSDDQASSMVTEYLSIQKDILKTKDKFLPRFNTVLPGKLVARYLQIENKLDTILMMGAVDGVPLVK